MMKEPATKSELVELVTSARAAWNELLAAIPPADMERAQVVGEWSIKDLVAHISWFENEIVDLLRTRALVGSDLWNLSTDERNHAIYLQSRDRPLEQVLSESQQIYTQLVALLGSLQDAELHDPSRYKDMPSDWLPWRVLTDNTYEHYQDHTQDIQAWLDREIS
ncbi:MAG TPA: DinB family protein [Anaerolineales bacterium]|nr:DinB family protein [Anaerolineales bacterium]